MRLLTAVSLVRVQQGEPKAKHRFTRCFVFVFREDVGQRHCGAAVSRLLTGSEPSAACGRYSEAENGQGQRALQASARNATMSQPAVVGSSPTGGARKARKHSAFGLSILQPHGLLTYFNLIFRHCKRRKAVILGYCLPEKSTIKYALGLHWQKSR